MREGWSVEIVRHDGTTFLCVSGLGVMPPVWPLAQRKHAVAHKSELKKEGFKARVVRVRFMDVKVVSRTDSERGAT